MGIESIPDTDIQYGLISFDADGNERPEPAGRTSQILIEKAKVDAVTDFFSSVTGGKVISRQQGNNTSDGSRLSPHPTT